ncbi:MAG: DUF1559 domain-containing protein [Planctomycetaceae bacterium]
MRSFRGLFILIGAIVLVGCTLITLQLRSQWRTVRRVQCKGHLSAIALGLHNYHDVYGEFPPAYTADSNGNRLHSWRTLILPFLNQSELCLDIDLTKPWDDPANAKARDVVVNTYVCFEADLENGLTIYHAVSGPDTVFPSDGSTRRLDQIADGADRTLMVVEVSRGQAVHWMDPSDNGLDFVTLLSTTTESPHAGGTQYSRTDGSTGFLSSHMPPFARQAMTTIAGNETSDAF